MDVLWQPDLFSGGGEVTVDTEFRTGWRTALDARSWVEVFPGWLAGANELFQRLAEGVPWQEHHRWLFRQRFLEPRLTAEYRQLADAPHPGLVAAGHAPFPPQAARRRSQYRFPSVGRRPGGHGRLVPGRVGPLGAQGTGHTGRTDQRQLPEFRAGAPPAARRGHILMELRGTLSAARTE